MIFSPPALLNLLPFSSSEGIGNLKSDKLSLVASAALAPNYYLHTYEGAIELYKTYRTLLCLLCWLNLLENKKWALLLTYNIFFEK